MIPPLMPWLMAPGDVPSIPFLEGLLHIGLLVRDQDGLRVATESELLEWDIPFVALCDHAVLQLRGATSWNQLVPVETLPGVFRVHAPDGLSASRLLCLDALLAPWPLEGAIVAVPDPRTLLVAPLEGLRAVPAVQALLRRAAAAHGDASLSDQLYWCDGAGEWSHLPVAYRETGVDLFPTAALIAALERATALDLVGVAAEA